MEEKDLFVEMIDESIEIDVSKLPRIVREEIKDLEKFHKDRDWLSYDLKFDELEAVAKSCILCGDITETTYKKLLAKYGGLYD